jgi:uncharacterized protein YndB with AHSA1/START domain
MTDDGGALAGAILTGTVDQHLLIPAPIDTVWSAFADAEFRGRWFVMPGPSASRTHSLDFRVGGFEITTGVFPNMGADEALEHRALITEIEPDEHITYQYELRLDGIRQLRAELTISFDPQPDGTDVRYLERYRYFVLRGDGSAERGEREGGTRFYLRRLGIAVAQRP